MNAYRFFQAVNKTEMTQQPSRATDDDNDARLVTQQLKALVLELKEEVQQAARRRRDGGWSGGRDGRQGRSFSPGRGVERSRGCSEGRWRDGGWVNMNSDARAK